MKFVCLRINKIKSKIWGRRITTGQTLWSRRHLDAHSLEVRIMAMRRGKRHSNKNKSVPFCCKWRRTREKKNCKRNRTCCTMRKDLPSLSKSTKTTLNSSWETKQSICKWWMRTFRETRWERLMSTMLKWLIKSKIKRNWLGLMQPNWPDLRTLCLQNTSNENNS